jgi:hypothetical protein
LREDGGPGAFGLEVIDMAKKSGLAPSFLVDGPLVFKPGIGTFCDP